MNCFGICDSLHRSRGVWLGDVTKSEWRAVEWLKIRKPLRGKWQNHRASSAWQQTRSPKRRGTPKYKRKQERGAGCVICQHEELPPPGAAKTSCPRGGLPQAPGARAPPSPPSLLSSPPSSLAAQDDLLWDQLPCCPTSRTHNFKKHLSGDKNSSPIFQSPKIGVKLILTQTLTQHLKNIILTWNQYKNYCILRSFFFFLNEAFKIRYEFYP